MKLDSYIEVHASCLVSASWVMRKRVKLHVSTSIAAAFPWCRRERRYNFFKKIKPPNISPVIGPPALKCSPCTKKFQVMMSTQALEVGGSRSNSSLPLMYDLIHYFTPLFLFFICEAAAAVCATCNIYLMGSVKIQWKDGVNVSVLCPVHTHVKTTKSYISALWQALNLSIIVSNTLVLLIWGATPWQRL